jgi:hypothetical protein
VTLGEIRKQWYPPWLRSGTIPVALPLLGRNGHAAALNQQDWRMWSRHFVRQMELLADET